MQINISSTAEVKGADIINFRSATSPDKSEYIAAIHAFCDSMANPLPPKEFGELDRLARLDVQRKTIVVQMSRYYKLHRTADVAPGVFAIITLLTDNDNGVCTMSEPALAELFGRSESAIHEARKRLKTDRMIETTRGRYAGSYPVIPRAISESYNHLVWTVEAMREFNPPATQGDCQSPCHTRGLDQSPCHTGGLKAVNPPVEPVSIPLPHGGIANSIPLPHRGQLLTSFLTDSKCPPNIDMSVPAERDDSLSRAAAALLIGLASSIPLADARADMAPVAQQGMQLVGGTSHTDSSIHAKPKRASPRKRTAVGYSEAFSKAWDAYPRTPTMSKAAAWKNWQREGCEAIGDIVAAAAAAEAVRCEREGTEPKFRKHMQGWISERRWEGMADAISRDAEKTEEQQVKAIALGFATGNWEHAKRWWKTSQDIPQRIRDLGRDYAQRELSNT